MDYALLFKLRNAAGLKADGGARLMGAVTPDCGELVNFYALKESARGKKMEKVEATVLHKGIDYEIRSDESGGGNCHLNVYRGHDRKRVNKNSYTYSPLISNSADEKSLLIKDIKNEIILGHIE
jgi:hypothetical protein